MDVSSLENIDKTSSLHSFYGINSIIEIMVAKIKEIPQFERLGKSIDLVLLICNQIENLIKDNKIKGDKNYKLDIAIKVFEKLGFSKAEDVAFVTSSVNFLHSNKRIKEVKLVKKVYSFVSQLFVKKLSE